MCMVRRVNRYSLLVKTIQGAPAARAGAPNPAMQLQRTGNVQMDEGRAWSGDFYDVGPVTDPEGAYGAFTGGEDVEAWLDRSDDGTIIGWVRDGDDIYRYSDPDAWSSDVDAAGMTYAGGEGQPAPDADPALEDPTLAGAPADPTDPFAEAAAPADGDQGANIGSDPEAQAQAPTAFADEEDLAVTDENPVAELSDPTALDAKDEEATNPFAGMSDDDANLANEPEDPAEEAAETPAEEAIEPAAPEDADPDAPEGETPEERKKRLAALGRIQVKHMPGKHNQEEHGNWSNGISIGTHAPRASLSAAGGGSPKGGEAPAKAPSKASVNNDSIARMSDEDLAALTESPDVFDADTMFAAATELDSRDDAHRRTIDALGDAAPGSADEAAVFDSVIPHDWSSWAARGAKGARPSQTRKQEIEDLWQQHWYALMQRASAFSNGQLLKPDYRGNDALAKAHLTVDDLFNGRMSPAQVRKYGSEELLRFFAEDGNGHLSYADWLAEFYPSYRKRRDALGSSYLSEHG